MISLSACLLMVAFLPGWYARTRPPVDQMQNLRQKIHHVRVLYSGMEETDQLPLKGAEDAFESTMALWMAENEKFFMVRNYRKARLCAENAALVADQALQKGLGRQQQMRDSLEARITELKQQIWEFEKDFGHFPYIKTDRDRLAEVRLSLTGASIAFDNDACMEAAGIVNRLEFEMGALVKKYNHMLEEYFRGLPQWEDWIDQAMRHSLKEETVVLIIEKISHQCLVVRNGEQIHRFPVELGPNWLGPKRWEGDRATPEGSYSVVRKKSGPDTRYYKALLIDYPNSEDRLRFQLDLDQGGIPEGIDQMGGSIEIHGMGGKGSDWTDGCIALSNEDMDVLYALCEKGTKVTIVGAGFPSAKNHRVALILSE